jgi:hypothetical protein
MFLAYSFESIINNVISFTFYKQNMHIIYIYLDFSLITFNNMF